MTSALKTDRVGNNAFSWISSAGLTSLAGIVFVSSAAHASALNPVQVSGSVYAYSSYFTEGGEEIVSEPSRSIGAVGAFRADAVTGGGNGHSYVSVSTSPFPFLSASVSSFAQGDGGSTGIAEADATLIYRIEFVGAPGPVPVFVRAGLTSNRSDVNDVGEGGEAYVHIGTNDTLVASTDDTGFISGNYDFQANTVYDVNMHIDLYTGSSFGDETTYVSGTVDPYFAIGPNVAGQYRIVLSDGVGNSPFVSAVPLPGAAPLFGAGLVALSAMGYGMKRKRSMAA